MATPKVSVIVPIYNVEPYLKRCIDSILNQTLRDLEVILVDDGSPDNCPKMCDEYALTDSRIKVIHKTNGGLGYARNSGMDVATGDYIGFVDSDDFIEPNMYEELYNIAIKENADAVRSNTLFDNNGTITEKKDVEQDLLFRGKSEVNAFLLDFVAPLPENYRDAKYSMSVWRGIYRRRILTDNSIEFLSERVIVSEDKPFCIDFFSHSNCIALTSKSYYHYCYNGNSLTKTLSREKLLKTKDLIVCIENKLKEVFTTEEYQLHLQRFILFELRCIIGNEKKLCEETGESWKEAIKKWTNDALFCNALKSYPFHRMPMKLKCFYLCLKHRLSILLSLYYNKNK